VGRSGSAATSSSVDIPGFSTGRREFFTKEGFRGLASDAKPRQSSAGKKRGGVMAFRTARALNPSIEPAPDAFASACENALAAWDADLLFAAETLGRFRRGRASQDELMAALIAPFNRQEDFDA